MKNILFLFYVALGLTVVFAGCAVKNPHVLIKTEMGDVILELYQEQAPVTAANFLRYVDEGLYQDSGFYRSVTMDNQPRNDVKIEVIQGGLYEDDRMYPSIAHETTDKTGIRHKDGILSMARMEPGTATSEFFICIGDQPELDYGGRRNSDGQGFAAFGRVVSGMEVVRHIQAQPADGQMLTPRVAIFNIVRL